jgi:hypothetical protein
LWDTAQDESKAASRTPPASSAKPVPWCAIRNAGRLQRPCTLSRAATINFYERAACMAFSGTIIAKAVAANAQLHRDRSKDPAEDYVAGQRRLDQCRALLPAVFEKSTCCWCRACRARRRRPDRDRRSRHAGDLDALHTPTITLPTHRGPNNLPVGIQLVGQRYDDERLIACAQLDLGAIGAPEWSE